MGRTLNPALRRNFFMGYTTFTSTSDDPVLGINAPSPEWTTAEDKLFEQWDIYFTQLITAEGDRYSVCGRMAECLDKILLIISIYRCFTSDFKALIGNSLEQVHRSSRIQKFAKLQALPRGGFDQRTSYYSPGNSI